MQTDLICLFVVPRCSSLENLSNGKVSYNTDPINKQYLEGSQASFTCNTGYNLSGSDSRTCQSSCIGNKFNQLDICETYSTNFQLMKIYLFICFLEVTCSALESSSNSAVSYDKDQSGGQYPVNTKASFSCNSGYLLSQSSSRKCQTSGDWSEKTPVCRGNKVILYGV